MKVLESILITLAVISGIFALVGSETADGNLSPIWFFGWALAAVLFGKLADIVNGRAKKC